MRVAGSHWPPLLALAVALSTLACRVNEAGLGAFGGHTAGAGGGGPIGSGGVTLTGGGGGSGGGSGGGGGGSGGMLLGAGGGGGGPAAGGASGTGGSSDSGTGGGSGGAGAGSGGGAGGDVGQPDAATTDAGNTVDGGTDARRSVAGCADGTREGFTSTTTYPQIAACAGGWDIPGVIAENTRAPACGRRAGNTGTDTITDGTGCSVADLCAETWHVCDTGAEVARLGGGCAAAIPLGTITRTFYVTRQRANGFQCPAANDMGANNLHGCGTAFYGVMELSSCAPFERSWSHDECDENAPWECGVDSNDMMEMDEVVKRGATRGGALCCRD